MSGNCLSAKGVTGVSLTIAGMASAKPAETSKGPDSKPATPPYPVAGGANRWFEYVNPTLDYIDETTGIEYDFNSGLRIVLPESLDGGVVEFGDADSGMVLYKRPTAAGKVVSCIKKYYIRFYVKVWAPGADEKTAPVFEHTLSLTDKPVLIHFPADTLGDTIAWFSYVAQFQRKHNAEVDCCGGLSVLSLFKEQYPDINFIDCSTFDPASKKYYATYRVGLWFDHNDGSAPESFREAGLHHIAGDILGIAHNELPPSVDLSAPREIPDKYVCIAVQASSLTKCWIHPMGWVNVVKYLKSRGYRVLCIDKEPMLQHGLQTNYIPNGAEDFTGNLPLQKRIDLIKHADMFIGLSSGLSWLAWCCKVPVILISGFTAPHNEFYTPYRVYNKITCHGCWNDDRYTFDHSVFDWCPKHANTPRHLECSKQITSKSVIDMIDKIIQ